ncbi:ParB N-terminal domain-containing protein [Sinorhizobium meliloti]|uniref:ParB N-terminal domain-containing protein n=1 Tax=Rhizobium meliloti TaxID=382 RepID=UPI0012FDBEEE|nr:ParB N-terminal domain-containing protein [Sinorhizobium meliloti]MDE3854861.1 ParB N-terminal domain-containing protein [Sinorhizobium meliloti]
MRKIEISRADLRADVEAGPAPILQWIDIATLVVDDSYQRDLKRANWTAIRRIASSFRWSMFSPVFVAPVEGGSYAIIDGQHRTHAAAMCGFSQVPCQIVQMTRTEQAAAFAAVNGRVTQVTVWQLFKAALAAGEGWAVTAQEIAKEGGCRILTYAKAATEKKPGEIYGIKGFVAVVEQRPRQHVVAALRMLKSANGYGDNQDAWDAWCLFPLLMALTERPAALANPGFQKALEGFDFWHLAERDHQERREKRRQGISHPPKSETLRAGVLDWIDKAFPQRVGAPPVLGKAAIMERVGAMKVG